MSLSVSLPVDLIDRLIVDLTFTRLSEWSLSHSVASLLGVGELSVCVCVLKGFSAWGVSYIEIPLFKLSFQHKGSSVDSG